MSEIFTLESLREEAEKKFGSVRIQLDETKTVTLRNLLRLSKAEKKLILAKLDEMDTVRDRAKAVAEKAKAAADDDQIEVTEDDFDDAEMDSLFVAMRDILKIAADRHGALLISAIGDDDTMVSTLFERWMKTAQVGEAKPSPTN